MPLVFNAPPSALHLFLPERTRKATILTELMHFSAENLKNMSYIPKPLTDQEMASLLADTGELDPVWEQHFYKPLMSLLAASGKKYHAEARPKYFGDARGFATKLWECHDEADMKSLIEAFSEGASQFAYVMLVTAFGMLPRHREIPLGVEPLDSKPYAALAFRGIEWLDDIEASNPGKTLPRL